MSVKSLKQKESLSCVTHSPCWVDSGAAGSRSCLSASGTSLTPPPGSGFLCLGLILGIHVVVLSKYRSASSKLLLCSQKIAPLFTKSQCPLSWATHGHGLSLNNKSWCPGHWEPVSRSLHSWDLYGELSPIQMPWVQKGATT